MTAPTTSSVVVLPDAGPLITLAYADALDLLLAPRWPVRVVDMVLEEVTRTTTPTSAKIARWVAEQGLPKVATSTCAHYRAARGEGGAKRAWSNLGELAIQEAMHTLALTEPDTTGIFLFEDHKIARTTFLVPDSCRKISTRAWLLFLEGRGWIHSASEVERAAIAAGRNFSRLRFSS